MIYNVIVTSCKLHKMCEYVVPGSVNHGRPPAPCMNEPRWVIEDANGKPPCWYFTKDSDTAKNLILHGQGAPPAEHDDDSDSVSDESGVPGQRAKCVQGGLSIKIFDPAGVRS